MFHYIIISNKSHTVYSLLCYHFYLYGHNCTVTGPELNMAWCINIHIYMVSNSSNNSILQYRDELVSKMCTSGGRQCKTVPIPGLRILVHPNQTWTFWMFPLKDIAIKVPKWAKYARNLYNFFRFLVCFQYFKFSLHYMCCQARFRL